MHTRSKKLLIFLVFPFVSASLFAQALLQQDTVYYPEVHPIAHEQLVYKTAPQIDELDFQVNEDLALRVYYPTDLEPGEQRPLVVLIHGGGFIGGAFGSFFDEAEALAQLGFVAASIQYRLCKRGDCLLAAGLLYPCAISWANSLIPSAYAAAVDAADAINWLQLHANDYHIDPDRVAVLGHSAGAITALNAAYMDQEEINDICMGCGTWPDYLGEELSPIDGLQAVINMSGAILDTLWIDETETEIDLMSIHGTHDGVVFYGSDPVYPCCNTFIAPVQGSCPITHRHSKLGGNTYLLSGMNHGHDVFSGDWWPDNQLQILWFLGQSFWGDGPMSKHSEILRPSAVTVCPPPLPGATPAELCQRPLSDPGVVIFGEVPVNTHELPSSANWKIFPNPASDQLVLETIALPIPSLLEVWTIQGQLIQAQQLTSSRQLVELSHLPPGVYSLRIGQEVKRLVIQR